MLPDPQETADLVTFTEEIFNENFHFLCSKYIGVACVKATLLNVTFRNLAEKAIQQQTFTCAKSAVEIPENKSVQI